MNEELYELLGVEKTATPAAIKAAYRHMAKSAHPDRGGDPDHFVEITIAYNTLMDPKAREAYDLSGQRRDDESVAAQARMISGLGELFQVCLLRSNRAVEETDIINNMRFEISRVEDVNKAEKMRLTGLLKSLHAVRSRIKRTNEKRNIFVEIADAKIKLASEEFKHVSMILSDIERMKDELSNYTSIVDLVRTVQAGMYATAPSPMNRPGLYSFINITTT